MRQLAKIPIYNIFILILAIQQIKANEATPTFRCAQVLGNSGTAFENTVNTPLNRVILTKSGPKTTTPLAMAPKEEFEYLSWRHRSGQRPEKIKQDLPRIIELAEQLLKDQGVLTERKLIEMETFGSLLTLIVIGKPNSDHPLEQKAYQLSETHPDLKVVYNPFINLHRGSEAYFSPKYYQLGIPHQMIPEAKPNLAFEHEWIHAGHFIQRQKGTDSIFFGTMNLLEGSSFISENHQFYHKFMTFEELNTTSYTAMENAKHLLKIVQQLRSENEVILENESFRELTEEIDSELRMLSAVSMQTTKIVNAALLALERSNTQVNFSESSAMTLPRQTQRQIVTAQFKFEFFEGIQTRSTPLSQNRRLVELNIPLVTERHHDAYRKQNFAALKNDLKSRLTILQAKAQQLNTIVGAMEGQIPRNFADVIEFDQINIVSLEQKLDPLVEALSQFWESPQ